MTSHRGNNAISQFADHGSMHVSYVTCTIHRLHAFFSEVINGGLSISVPRGVVDRRFNTCFLSCMNHSKVIEFLDFPLWRNVDFGR
jgi:hypothetical protein